jgi:hypothetical protein
MNLGEIIFKHVDRIQLAQDRDQLGGAVVNAVMNPRVS